MVLPERICEALLEAREEHGWSDEEMGRKAVNLATDRIMYGEAFFCPDTGKVLHPGEVSRVDEDIIHTETGRRWRKDEDSE